MSEAVDSDLGPDSDDNGFVTSDPWVSYMPTRTGDVTVGITAGSAFNLDIERDVFDGMDATLRPVDIETTKDLITELEGVDAVIDRLLAAPYTEEVINALESCRVIARCGIGTDAIAVDRATERGITVVNVPTYCQHEVSDHAITLLLALQRKLAEYDTAMKDGVWAQDVTSTSVHRIRGQTLGLVGFGTIARLVAEKANAFGMNVIASDPYVDSAEMKRHDVEKVPFEELLDRSDAVSLHAPLVEETRGKVDADAFDRMKESATLINVARGALVAEDDLARALRNGEIAGAGLDVFEEEPSGQGEGFPLFETPLQNFENVILTPHIAWFSHEANTERRRTAARDVRRVLEGKSPMNPVQET